MTQLSSELLQIFVAVIRQPTHWVPVRFAEDFIHGDAAYTLIDGVKKRDVKQQLLKGGNRSQAL
jgi:hypothetical protein